MIESVYIQIKIKVLKQRHPRHQLIVTTDLSIATCPTHGTCQSTTNCRCFTSDNSLNSIVYHTIVQCIGRTNTKGKKTGQV
jgi:delta-aminolevulinic acid dehydratase/porphobilinogen synthase